MRAARRGFAPLGAASMTFLSRLRDFGLPDYDEAISADIGIGQKHRILRVRTEADGVFLRIAPKIVF